MAALKFSFALVLLIVASISEVTNGQNATTPIPTDFEVWSAVARGLSKDALTILGNLNLVQTTPPPTTAAPIVPAGPQVIYINGQPYAISPPVSADLYAQLLKANPPPVAPTPAFPIIPVAPVTAAPIVPVTAAPVAPVTAAPMAPVTAAPMAPVTAAPMAPVTAAPAATTANPWNDLLKLYMILNGPQTQQPPVVVPASVTAAPPCVPTPAPCTGPACKPEQVRIVLVNDCNNQKSSESCSEESHEVSVVVPRSRSRY